MLNIDMGSGASDGLIGPYLDFKARVTDAAPAKAWLLRSRDDDTGEYAISNITAQVEKGIVIDVEQIMLGWEKNSPMGSKTAPERVWAPTPDLKAHPRPSDERREGDDGKMRPVWKETYALRCAVGGGVAATWSQSTFGTFSAVRSLVNAFIAAAPANPGKLPLVAVTGYRSEYNTHIPLFSILNFVDRPACLNADAPSISMGGDVESTLAPQPAPVAAPAPAPVQAAPAAPIPEDAFF